MDLLLYPKKEYLESVVLGHKRPIETRVVDIRQGIGQAIGQAIGQGEVTGEEGTKNQICLEINVSSILF
jgi:hypothetical protein